MKAIVQEKYGAPTEVLSLRELEAPKPRDDEVLVKVRGASVNQADWLLVTGTPKIARLGFGLFKPKQRVPGRDLAGTVEAIGSEVTCFKPGDEVFGEADGGTFAEYACVSEKLLARKPNNLGFEDAAAIPLAGVTALQGLRDHGQLESGQHILINGASGGVGSFAVTVAKALGAEVTAVCSTNNVATAEKLGADRIIDYTRESFTDIDQCYDLIFDIAASQPLASCRQILKPGGRFVSSAGAISSVFKVALASLVKGWVVGPWMARTNPDDLIVLKELAEQGKLVPAIAERVELGDVPRAVERQGKGHARGKTVIRV